MIFTNSIIHTMIESLFDPPHNATDAEIKAMYSHCTVEHLRAFAAGQQGDGRLIGIWNLYQHRGDEAKMHETEARFEDQRGSPDEAQRNPGNRATFIPYSAMLHTGYLLAYRPAR